MLIHEQLKTTKFSSSDKYIADYFLQHIDMLKDKTIRDIAKENYCSPSTILRFTKRLGFDGYNDFKEQYLKENEYLESHFQDIDPNCPFTSNDKPMTIGSKIGTLFQEIIADNMSLLDHDTLYKAVKLLKSSKNISIVASASQIGMAYSFKDKFAKIGKNIMIHTHSDEAYYDACMSEETCFILISYSGETSRCLKIAHKLNERNINFITLTSYGASTLASLSSCILHVSTREKLIDNLGAYAMNISTLYLLDVLYSCYFSLDYQINKERKDTYSKEFETLTEYLGRDSNNPILK